MLIQKTVFAYLTYNAPKIHLQCAKNPPLLSSSDDICFSWANVICLVLVIYFKRLLGSMLLMDIAGLEWILPDIDGYIDGYCRIGIAG